VNAKPFLRWALPLTGVAAACLAGAVALVQCTHPAAADGPGECACSGQQVVDGTLLAFLSKARAAHHRADLAQEDGDVDLAIAALERITAAPRLAAPEAVEVLADTYARLADLKSDLGQHEAALRDVEAGLALATTPTHFRGHLYEMKGVVLERRYRVLEATGEAAAAAELKAQALEAFKSAIDVQEQVINDALSHDKH
jgi:tetratricopeptide (TPR) repeat protein